mgnify:CR=1 FL=1
MFCLFIYSLLSHVVINVIDSHNQTLAFSTSILFIFAELFQIIKNQNFPSFECYLRECVSSSAKRSSDKRIFNWPQQFASKGLKKESPYFPKIYILIFFIKALPPIRVELMPNLFYSRFNQQKSSQKFYCNCLHGMNSSSLHSMRQIFSLSF